MFEPKSHTVLRLGAAMVVVVATTADIAFAGATKKVARATNHFQHTGLGSKHWVPWMDVSMASHLLCAHHSSVGCRQRTLLRDRIDNLEKEKKEMVRSFINKLLSID